MSINDLIKSSDHRNNVLHIVAMVNIVLSDGEITEKEGTSLLRLAHKLNISNEEYEGILKNSGKHPIDTLNNKEERLRRIYDLFKIIYANHYIDATEEKLIQQYAIGLGCTSGKAKIVIQKSIQIFGGSLAFEDYQHLLDY